MDISRFKPWNWFKKEEETRPSELPVRRDREGVYGNLGSLHEEVDRLFDEAFRSFGLPSLFRGSPAGAPSSPGAMLRPSVDISATKKEYALSVEVPGIEEKDIQIELSGTTLTIRGEKRQEQEEKERDFYRIERSYGSFQRVLSLPDDADSDGIKAKFKNGVLTIRLPRKSEHQKDAKLISVEKG
jgi:HSP20 family protein